MGKSDALHRLSVAVGITEHRVMTISRRQDMIMSAMRGSSRLIILDEATRPHSQVLETFRDISDDTECALVLAGREHLRNLLESNAGRYAEIGSRVQRWYPPVQSLTNDDMDKMFHAAFPEGMDEQRRQVLIKCSQNNGRVFAHLIDAMFDLETNTGTRPSADQIRELHERFIIPNSFVWQDRGAETQ